MISIDLKEIAETARKTARLSEGDVVLNIGANDGTLLGSYPYSLLRVGCEPARNLTPYLREVTSDVIADFWGIKTWQDLMRDTKVKVVTAIGMFYDMDDPNQFIADVAKVLDEDGLFIAQLMCLKSMLKKNDLGNICHEHLEYSYRSLKYLFESNGLEIFKVEENEINGGSYRLYARHLKKGSIEIRERCSKGDVLRFYKRIKANKRACVRLIRAETRKGKKVFAYGASTKGNTILQYYGLYATIIRGVADKG